MGNIKLTDKQQQFFLRQKQLINNTDMGMRGAIQMIIDEQGVAQGKISLSEDCSEIIIEPEEKL